MESRSSAEIARNLAGYFWVTRGSTSTRRHVLTQRSLARDGGTWWIRKVQRRYAHEEGAQLHCVFGESPEMVWTLHAGGKFADLTEPCTGERGGILKNAIRNMKFTYPGVWMLNMLRASFSQKLVETIQDHIHVLFKIINEQQPQPPESTTASPYIHNIKQLFTSMNTCVDHSYDLLWGNRVKFFSESTHDDVAIVQVQPNSATVMKGEDNPLITLRILYSPADSEGWKLMDLWHQKVSSDTAENNKIICCPQTKEADDIVIWENWAYSSTQDAHKYIVLRHEDDSSAHKHHFELFPEIDQIYTHAPISPPVDSINQHENIYSISTSGEISHLDNESERKEVRDYQTKQTDCAQELRQDFSNLVQAMKKLSDPDTFKNFNQADLQFSMKIIQNVLALYFNIIYDFVQGKTGDYIEYISYVINYVIRRITRTIFTREFSDFIHCHFTEFIHHFQQKIKEEQGKQQASQDTQCESLCRNEDKTKAPLGKQWSLFPPKKSRVCIQNKRKTTCREFKQLQGGGGVKSDDMNRLRDHVNDKFREWRKQTTALTVLLKEGAKMAISTTWSYAMSEEIQQKTCAKISTNKSIINAKFDMNKCLRMILYYAQQSGYRQQVQREIERGPVHVLDNLNRTLPMFPYARAFGLSFNVDGGQDDLFTEWKTHAKQAACVYSSNPNYLMDLLTLFYSQSPINLWEVLQQLQVNRLPVQLSIRIVQILTTITSYTSYLSTFTTFTSYLSEMSDKIDKLKKQLLNMDETGGASTKIHPTSDNLHENHHYCLTIDSIKLYIKYSHSELNVPVGDATVNYQVFHLIGSPDIMEYNKYLKIHTRITHIHHETDNYTLHVEKFINHENHHRYFSLSSEYKRTWTFSSEYFYKSGFTYDKIKLESSNPPRMMFDFNLNLNTIRLATHINNIPLKENPTVGLHSASDIIKEKETKLDWTLVDGLLHDISENTVIQTISSTMVELEPKLNFLRDMLHALGIDASEATLLTHIECCPYEQ